MTYCLLFLLSIAFASPAAAQRASRLGEFLQKVPLEQIFPGADRLGPVEGEPPAAAAYAGETPLGWVFLNSDIVSAIGYSGKPIHVVVGVSSAGEIVGARMVEHTEPIVLIGIPDARIHAFIDGYVGFNVMELTGRRQPPVDIVSGATVTVVVIGDTMVRAAMRLLRSRGALAGVAEVAEAPLRPLDLTQSGQRSWEELLGDGSVRRMLLTLGEINEAFAAVDPRAAGRPERGEPDEPFIDLYAALVSAPVIGESLLGPQAYAQLRARLGEGEQAVLIAGYGRYSFRGTGFVRGAVFDRIEVIQGDTGIRFRDRDYTRLRALAPADAPYFEEIGLFVVPAQYEMRPDLDWRLQLLVYREVAALQRVFLTYDLTYQLPDHHLVAPPEPQPAQAQPMLLHDDDEGEALWVRLWEDKAVAIGVLVTALLLLTGAFFFQDLLARRPRVTWWFRTGFLAFTLVWLGWWMNAQLSVVNTLTLTNAVMTGFSWDFFLLDPLLFILWAAVAASLLFWARGAFCGWLCPFGALQEFVNRAARFLRVPQISVPWGLHERLWPVKYIIFMGLFGLSLYSLLWAEKLAEVEPFKTAIVLNFIREWPFVLYAVALLVGAMFIDRFFCRYLCPLGAGLAVPARLRMFDWLKRHRECGNPCQRCAIECPVASIHPDGRINPNECIYCMHCQTLYWDEYRCPAMIQRRLKRERAKAMSPAPAQALTQGRGGE